MPDSLPAFIRYGRIGRPHGVRGQITFHPYFAQSGVVPRIKAMRVIHGAQAPVMMRVSSCSGRPGAWIVTLEGVSAREQAQALTDAEVWIDASLIPPLAEGEFYSFQLEGLKAVRPDGTVVGEVLGLEDFGAGDLLALRVDGQLLYLPFAEPHVGDVDLQARTVCVRPAEFLSGDGA
jgi:16S rRNA processing protein RimM